jgi:hypothetical protein
MNEQRLQEALRRYTAVFDKHFISPAEFAVLHTIDWVPNDHPSRFAYRVLSLWEHFLVFERPKISTVVAAVQSCLRRGWIQIITPEILTQIRVEVADGFPLKGLPEIDSYDFTRPGVELYGTITRDLSRNDNSDWPYQSEALTVQRYFFVDEEHAKNRREVELQSKQVGRVTPVVPAGPWKRHWWGETHQGFSFDVHTPFDVGESFS